MNASNAIRPLSADPRKILYGQFGKGDYGDNWFKRFIVQTRIANTGASLSVALPMEGSNKVDEQQTTANQLKILTGPLYLSTVKGLISHFNNMTLFTKN